MSTYITLDRIQVQNANCIAGLTYGFPAITHFLGFIHALSRQLQNSHGLKLEGCAVICHQHQAHAYQPKGFGEYIFSQTRNPLTRTGEVAPIFEEGKMHMTVSLVTRCEGLIEGGEEGALKLKTYLEQLCLSRKLAGGVINHLKKVNIETANNDDQQRKLNSTLRRRLLPGFLLLDKTTHLKKYRETLEVSNADAELFDAWIDFTTLRYKAEPLLEANEILSEKTKAEWKYISKPEPGYLVPLAIGYRALSDEYEAGVLTDTRDASIPFCFVEAAYGLGEWLSPHRLKHIDDALWFYQKKDGWYLCGNAQATAEDTSEDDDNFDFL